MPIQVRRVRTNHDFCKNPFSSHSDLPVSTQVPQLEQGIDEGPIDVPPAWNPS